MMASNRHTVANGQLGSSSGSILAGLAIPASGAVDLVLRNITRDEQVVELTIQVSGGTARQLPRIVLSDNESVVVGGIKMDADDTLAGSTTDASSVDYVAFAAGPGSGFRVEPLSADGTSKAMATIRKLLLGVEVMVGGELADPGV